MDLAEQNGLLGAPRLAEDSTSAGSSALPPSAGLPNPMMMASSELGVYVKWALLLQEQLEHVQAERLAVLQRCLKLQADNQLLRQTLQEENPTKYAHLAPPNAQPSQAVSVQASGSRRSVPQVAALSAPTEVIPMSSGSSAFSTTAPGGNGAPLLEPDVLNAPNLQLLASFLKDEDQGKGNAGGPAAPVEQRQASNTHTRRRANHVHTANAPVDQFVMPPLASEPSGEDISRASKVPRKSQAGRTVSSYNALAAASARKAARCGDSNT